MKNAFLAFFSANVWMTLSKLIDLANSDSIASVPKSVSLSWHIVERKQFLIRAKQLKERSPSATVTGIEQKIRSATQQLGNSVFRWSTVNW